MLDSFSKGISLIIIISIIYSCSSESANSVAFQKISFEDNMEFDTLEKYNNDSLLFVDIIHSGALGNSSMSFGVIRNFGTEKILYNAPSIKIFRISKNYIAQINSDNFSKTNWGWYNINQAKQIIPLINYKKIVDSLNIKYPSPFFVSYTAEGFIDIFQNGKSVKQLYYGNIILGSDSLNFENLKPGLYKITGNQIILVSQNPDDLLNNGGGTFFVAKPGLGVTRKFKKSDIESIFMSYKTIKIALL